MLLLWLFLRCVCVCLEGVGGFLLSPAFLLPVFSFFSSTLFCIFFRRIGLIWFDSAEITTCCFVSPSWVNTEPAGITLPASSLSSLTSAVFQSTDFSAARPIGIRACAREPGPTWERARAQGAARHNDSARTGERASWSAFHLVIWGATLWEKHRGGWRGSGRGWCELTARTSKRGEDKGETEEELNTV